MSKPINVVQTMKENLTSIVPSIEFPCVVDGKKILARMTHLDDNPIHNIVHISFSDGYKTSFFSIEDQLGYYEQGKGNTSYAKAVRNDLRSIGFINLDKEIHCPEANKSGEDANVWILQDWDDDRKYDVRSKGQYRFSVIRTEKGWLEGHISPKAKLTKADDLLAAEVTKLIDSRRGG